MWSLQPFFGYGCRAVDRGLIGIACVEDGDATLVRNLILGFPDPALTIWRIIRSLERQRLVANVVTEADLVGA